VVGDLGDQRQRADARPAPAQDADIDAGDDEARARAPDHRPAAGEEHGEGDTPSE
jgi:hypothetical protein